MNVRIYREDQGRTKAYIYETISSLNKIIADLRNYILDLKPLEAGGVDIVEAIARLVDDFKTSSSLAVDLNFTGVPPASFNPVNAQHLHQIVREALNNILRHAQATEVQVQVQFQERATWVTIMDNGIGFDPLKMQAGPQSGRKHGLLNMNERAACCGGSCHINSRPGKGTIVTVNIPYGVDING